MSISVSVVLPTYNRKLSLMRCLASIPEDVEIVVVDDGSYDGTGEAVKKLSRPHLTYIRQSNAGPAAARNSGIGASSGHYIAFTDDDCVPVSPWPWPLIHRLKQEDIRIAGVGGRVLPLRSGLLSRYYTFHRILEPPESCSYLVTANCVYRKEALEAVGGFDIDIKQPGGEDPGLSIKIRAKGYRLAFEPQAVVLHDYREGLLDFVKTFYRYGKGCAHVMGKRINSPTPVA